MNAQEQNEFDALVAERDGAKLVIEELKERLALKTPAEAGFSLNLTLGAGDLITGGQITARTDFVTDALKVMEKVEALVKARGWRWAEPLAKAPPPVESKAAAIVRAEGNTALADQLAKPPDVGPIPDGKEWQTMDIETVESIPQPGDVINIIFYKAGHTKPDLKCQKWKIERAAGLMKHVTNADMSKPWKAVCACRVYYTIGKAFTYNDPNTGELKSGNYKDVAHVRLIE